MALAISDLVYELQTVTAWQETPQVLSYQDYEDMILRGIRRLFIDTGRAAEYKRELYIDGFFEYNCLIDEEEYIILCSEIEFFKRVQSDVNNNMGYTTDALSVTGADKPYANLRNTIEELENRRRELYYRMVRFTIDYEV